MTKYRVKETFKVKVWTYVTAENKEQAIKKLDDDKGEPDFDNPLDETHLDTKYERWKKCK